MRPLPAGMAALAAHPNFILVRLVPSVVRPGRTEKLPVDWRTGQVVDAHDRSHWMAYHQAAPMPALWGDDYTLGWVLTREAGLWCVDVDHCLVGGQWSDTARRLMHLLQGAAVELSQSREGLHLWGRGHVPAHSSKCAPLGLELYTEARFIALTGEVLAGDASTDHSAAMASLVPACFPPKAEVAPADWTDGPCEGWRGPADDAELIRRAMASHSAAGVFGGRASFADLWTANADALARAYPGDQGGYDRSSADAALAQHLAFWTGKDCARIERLMRQSALVRDKWDRDDYLGPRTILGAVARQVQVLQDKPTEVVAAPAATLGVPQQRVVEGNTFLSPAQQVEMFRGCVYVVSQHRVLVPGGPPLLKPDQFRSKFGGFTFALDNRNERTGRNAWEAFTESQALRAPQADDATFRPDLPPVALVKDGGQQLQPGEQYQGRLAVNTWWPPVIVRQAGDVSPWLRHLELLIPNERDRWQVIYWLAAAAQNPGVKFQYMLLLQGVEGNGKTLLSCLAAKALGERYVHWPSIETLGKNFNAWMENRLLVCLEDIYIPNSERHILERLKPMIAGGAALEIEGKGLDQRSASVCCNFIANTNHKSGVPKSANDRRIMPVFTAQQVKADLARCGMDRAYFQRMYRWVENGGYAIGVDWLLGLAIPEDMNPALGGPAPVTASTAEAIAQGRGAIEQEVIEAIEQGKPGFAGGWVSSIALDRLLADMGREAALGRSRRPDMLHSLGFIKHPGLDDGRVNNQVMPDGGKPRLFVREDSPLATLTGAAEIARAYSQAQLAAG